MTAARISTIDSRAVLPETALTDPRLVRAAHRVGTATVRRALADVLSQVGYGETQPGEVVAEAIERLPGGPARARPVINATGVLLHAGLGRAVLSEPARTAVQAAAGCVDIEFDLDTGRRSRRGRPALAALVEAVPSAGSAYVVNNNAAALVLAATALASGRDIVVSRAELAELPDRSRLPELLVSTGARLLEVGTVHGTTLADYHRATWSGTGFILRIIPAWPPAGDFRSQVEVEQLVGLGVPVIVDVQSGLLRPEPALPGETDVHTVLSCGATLVTASGDTLLGGPQAGLLLGTRPVIDQLRRHPLARAMRADKLTLAALEATLNGGTTPTRTAIRSTVDELRRRGEALLSVIRTAGVAADLVPTEMAISTDGSGGGPLPSLAVSLPRELARPLRRGVPAVVGRVRDGRLLLDLRPVPRGQDTALAAAILVSAGVVVGPATGPAAPQGSLRARQAERRSTGDIPHRKVGPVAPAR